MVAGSGLGCLMASKQQALLAGTLELQAGAAAATPSKLTRVSSTPHVLFVGRVMSKMSAMRPERLARCARVRTPGAQPALVACRALVSSP